ncbi:MAG: hypothetical protein K6G28_01310 [Acholeplasmatales bacterium]|nr:hypothetical protein [Acholeplasmatales bacterium]
MDEFKKIKVKPLKSPYKSRSRFYIVIKTDSLTYHFDEYGCSDGSTYKGYIVLNDSMYELVCRYVDENFFDEENQ